MAVEIAGADLVRAAALLGAGLAMGLGALGPGLGEGFAAGKTCDEILERADAAMYEAKRAGKNRWAMVGEAAT